MSLLHCEEISSDTLEFHEKSQTFWGFSGRWMRYYPNAKCESQNAKKRNITSSKKPPPTVEGFISLGFIAYQNLMP